jgi:DNA-binding LytR/AlgR family response regulator
VIFLSAYSHFAGDRRLPETFATIGKPFETKALVELVERCAAQPKDD